jgi:hypothetical protein
MDAVLVSSALFKRNGVNPLFETCSQKKHRPHASPNLREMGVATWGKFREYLLLGYSDVDRSERPRSIRPRDSGIHSY